MRSVPWLLLGLLVGCSEPTGPKDRADVVGGAWVVQLGSGKVCFQQDLYHSPEMDEASEAIRACRARQR